MYDILVNTTNFEKWSRDAQYGTQLAALMHASVTGAYIYPSPLYATPSFSSPELIEALIETSRAIEASALGAEQPFITWAHGMGIERAAWVVGEGNFPDALVQIACWHDLVVLERDPERRTWAAPSDLASLILAVGLPCIVVPPQPVAGVALSRIAVAWNGSPEAIRAVHAALPLLQRADEVLLLRGEPEELFQKVSWKPPFDIDAYLNRHGIHARPQDLVDTDGIGEAMLEQTDRFHADLLVMGAYGRSRFSEWALGGATRHVLCNARLPVLFRH